MWGKDYDDEAIAVALDSSASLSAAYAQGSKEGRDNTFFLILSERGRKVKYGINRKRTLYFTLCELDKTRFLSE
jgi:hypothetical protein